ncbi:MAG: alpha/beta hydrolase family protein [Victivallaceae bacterium]
MERRKQLGLGFAALMLGIASALMAEPAGNASAQQPGQEALFNAGYKVIDLKYQKDGQEQTLTLAVWYPTEAQAGIYNYGGIIKGNVAPDAMPSAKNGPYPLLVFSHGYGGSGVSSVFFSEVLAARGWIVACPDHHDQYSAVRIKTGQNKAFDRQLFLESSRKITNSTPDDRHKYLYRIDEISAAIDGIVNSGDFGKLIDKKRIAVGGHSLGGFTALGVSGTIRERRDPRIKAVLLFSTGAGAYLFRSDELSAVSIPSMLLMGEKERNQIRGSQTMSKLSDIIYNNLPAPKYFLEVRGGNHFSFNNRLSDNFSIIPLGGTEKQFEVIRSYSIAFLEKYVSGKQDQNKILEHSVPMLTRYIVKLPEE